MNPMNWLALFTCFNLLLLGLISKIHFFSITSLDSSCIPAMPAAKKLKIFF